jgi:hypothetical protein
MKFI